MTHATEPDGNFYIQVRREPPGGPRLEEEEEDVYLIPGSQRHLDAAADLGRRAADSLGKLFGEGVGPHSGSVEFSLTFEGTAGIPLLAKGKAGATITVTLRCENARSLTDS